ncbi:MAG: type II toxin-antitoxin system VapC family toxin [Bauldia sp.]|nr:type II toxin-antitoxin system VapC family toxin [Bauldia sp.]
MLPNGARKRALDEALERFVAQFDGRILPFSLDAAWAFGKIVARRRNAGRPIGNSIDLQIAAIARVAGMAAATRKVMDFQECGVEVVDPWTA